MSLRDRTRPTQLVIVASSILLAFVALSIRPASSYAAPGRIEVGRLQTDYATNPLGIGDRKPGLSWRLHSPTNGERQTAYRLLVATSPRKLTPGEADIWDSGKVESADSVSVPYGGPALQARQRYYWKVRVWDAENHASDWSSPAWWEMGLLSDSDWQGAQWISPRSGDDLSWSDFTLDADFTIKQGSASFLFRARDASDFYMWQINTVLEPGKVLLRPHVRENGGWSLLSAVDISSVIGQDALHDRHHIRIKAAGDQFTTWIDGEQVDSRTDDTLARGTIGFRSSTSANGRPEDALYDNVEVRSPDGETLFSDDFSSSPDKWFQDAPISDGRLEPPSGVTLATRPQPASPLLRTDFVLDKPVARARAYVYGLGLYELHLNGDKVGDHVLAPANSHYESRSLYDTYDVTGDVHEGANAVGMWLGDGYDADYSQYANRWLGPKEAIVLLDVTYTDGTHRAITSNDGWTWSPSAITADDIYDGEKYDARLEQPGWDRAGFDASTWKPVSTAAAPSDDLVPDAMPPIRVTRTLTPVRMTEPRPGVWVFDCGQNIAGWARLHARGPAGTTVQLRTAEELDADGMLDTYTNRNAASTDRYTLAGVGHVETWEPRFTYHGFRYVEVTGFPGTPTLDSVDCRVAHADVASTGRFHSSDELLNQIWQNNRWTIVNNSMSTPTDTPVRDERTPPGMDVQAYQDASTREFAMDRFYAKYLGPNPGGGSGSPEMSQDDITLAWTLYEQYGDSASLARAYPGIKRSIDAMAADHPDLIWPEEGFGDWCPPDHGPGVNGGMGSPSAGGYGVCMSEISLVDTALWYLQTTDVAKAAAVLGHEDDAAHYERLAEDIKDAFNDHFYNEADSSYGDGRQVTSVLPLAFGMVPEDKLQAVGDRLVDTILEKDDGHLDTGIFGTRYLVDALARIGRIDVAMTVLDQTTYPGFGFEISKGATTAWEEWLYYSSMETHDHAMFAGINASLYTELAGIRPTAEGYRNVEVKPHVPKTLDHVTASLDTVRGEVESSWRKSGDALRMTVTIPVNATGTVYVPTAGGPPVADSDGATLLRVRDGYAVFSVGSGTYRFVSHLAR